MASPRILNQKKNQYRESKMKPITSLAEKSNPNTVYTEQKQNKLQQTKHRGVYQKKKNTQYTNQNQTPANQT